MKAINVYSFCQGVNTLASLARRQPKDTASFFSKILAVRNSPDNLNKSQHVPQDINVHTGLIGKRQAPPRPAQPELALKLKMAMADFKQDPEMAREKWGLSKGIPEQHTGKREAPPRPAQPELALKLKMAMADFKQNPEMAREKWGLSKGIPEQYTGKREAPPRPAQPELALKLKMAMADFKQDPEMAREKWGLSKGIPE